MGKEEGRKERTNRKKGQTGRKNRKKKIQGSEGGWKRKEKNEERKNRLENHVQRGEGFCETMTEGRRNRKRKSRKEVKLLGQEEKIIQ